jgi:hypothetical protein
MLRELQPHESGMEAAGFSEKLAVISQTLWCHIPRPLNLYHFSKFSKVHYIWFNSGPNGEGPYDRASCHLSADVL